MKKNRNGFTLAELLIVVAIIAVLVAISIPIFTSQLEKAREATDAANIRSQYAEVMTEAITDGSDVNGKDLFGAVELKQKKDRWQSSGLEENLESVYQKVEGEYPKTGGTAWIEYKDEKTILHYEDGSGNSGSGNSGNTGGGSTSGGSTGGKSGYISNSEYVREKLKTSSIDLPELQGDETFQVERGKIYSYQGKYYVALNTPTLFSKYYTAYPESNNAGNWLYVQLSEDAEVLNSNSMVKKPDGSYELHDLERGKLYETSNGSVYIRAWGSANDAEPSEGNTNWQLIDLR